LINDRAPERERSLLVEAVAESLAVKKREDERGIISAFQVGDTKRRLGAAGRKEKTIRL